MIFYERDGRIYFCAASAGAASHLACGETAEGDLSAAWEVGMGCACFLRGVPCALLRFAIAVPGGYLALCRCIDRPEATCVFVLGRDGGVPVLAGDNGCCEHWVSIGPALGAGCAGAFVHRHRRRMCGCGCMEQLSRKLPLKKLCAPVV